MAACLWNILKASRSIQQPLKAQRAISSKLFSWERVVNQCECHILNMAHAGVKNAYRVTIHTWCWAWHLKPCVVQHLSIAPSSSVTTNSLRLIRNHPRWRFVQLHSTDYWTYVHWNQSIMIFFQIGDLSTLLFQRTKQAEKKPLQCIINGKQCSVWNVTNRILTRSILLH